jgi:hypothetical protein
MTVRRMTVRMARRVLPAGVLAMMLVPLPGFAQEPQPFSTSRLRQASTTIQAINQSDRHIVLLGPDGQRLMLEAGPQVENFNDVRPGDRVVVSYYDGIVAEVKPPGEGTPGTKGASKAVTSPPGDMPAGAVGKTVVTTVRVDSVDADNHTISFKRPDGITRKMAVEHPDAQRFIGQLKPGDEVQVTYREATAVSIEPARG